MFFKYKFCILFLFSIVIYHVKGYAYIDKAVIHPKHPGKCYDDITKRYVLTYYTIKYKIYMMYMYFNLFLSSSNTYLDNE